jgi:hypothetical protein
MPAAADAALVVALLVSPGFMLLQGYRRGRAYTVPDRDLYVLAQAVVASLGWLALVWLVLLFVGDPVKNWGLLPTNNDLLERHRGVIALLVLGVELVPFALGLLAGFLANIVQAIAWARAAFSWTGFFEPPTAWEYAWGEAASRAERSGSGWIAVSVRLKSGAIVEGRYGAQSRADLSPRPHHHVFIETAYGLDDAQTPTKQLGDGTIGGVFIDASEIATIYFQS